MCDVCGMIGSDVCCIDPGCRNLGFLVFSKPQYRTRVHAPSPTNTGARGPAVTQRFDVVFN